MRIGNFPETVNDNAARIVAGSVFFLSLAAVFTASSVVTAVILAGFIARVLYGPRFDPVARLTVDFIVPRLKIGNRPVAGPPKRFAQMVGLLFSLTALLLLQSGQIAAFTVVLGTLVFFAGLEAFFGFCAGCFVFGYLMKFGLVPDEICEQCNNLSRPPV